MSQHHIILIQYTGYPISDGLRDESSTLHADIPRQHQRTGTKHFTCKRFLQFAPYSANVDAHSRGGKRATDRL